MAAGKINWIAVRTAYVVKGYSAQKCADEFHIDPTTVKKRASAEGWTKERHRLATHATTVAEDEAREQVAQAGAKLREEHAEIVGKVHRFLDGIDDDLAAIKPGRGRIEARKAAAEAAEKVLKTSRLVLGISEGISSASDGEDTGERAVIFEEVAEAQSA